MPLTIKITEIGPTPGMFPRVYKALLRAALAAGAELWIDKFIPFHFQKKAFSRYGYKKRKGMEFARGTKAFRDSYTGDKLRRKGHIIPLVFSGNTRNLAKQSEARPIARRVDVITRAPTLNLRNSNSDINMREEFQTFTPAELEAMARAMDRKFQLDLNAARVRGVRQIGAKALGRFGKGQSLREASRLAEPGGSSAVGTIRTAS